MYELSLSLGRLCLGEVPITGMHLPSQFIVLVL